MKKNWIEISANVLFWILTSWLIISWFSIEVKEIEIINDEVKERIFRSHTLVRFYILGQFIFVSYFYIQLYLILKFANRTQIKNLVFKSIGLIILFLGILYGGFMVFYSGEINNLPIIWFTILPFYAAIAISYGFIKVWLKNEQDKKQLELVKNQAELNLLRSQLHPHFLFNTMNNLLAMVDQNESPRLAKSIDKLSNLLRYVVYDVNREKVTISDELHFIKNFSELHLLRFEEEEIEFNLEVKGSHKQQTVEPGIFLCYVENAFKHGVQPEFKSFLNIKVDTTEAHNITFQIENSIPPKIQEKAQGGYGLKSNEERLKLAYPNRHVLTITEEETYRVNLKINTDESNYSR